MIYINPSNYRLIREAYECFSIESDYEDLSEGEKQYLYRIYNKVKLDEESYCKDLLLYHGKSISKIVNNLLKVWLQNKSKSFLQEEDYELDSEDLFLIWGILAFIRREMEKAEGTIYNKLYPELFDKSVDYYKKVEIGKIKRKTGKTPGFFKPIYDPLQGRINDWYKTYTLPALTTVHEKYRPVLEGIIKEGYRDGLPLKVIAENMRKAVDPYNKDSKTKYILERIARTELAFIVEHTKLEVYRGLGIERVQFVTRRDKHVCADCRPREGAVFPINDIPPDYDIPIHSHCRCTWVPVYDPDEFLFPFTLI